LWHFEKVGDLRWWLTALWGYIVQRNDAWKQEDEARWEESIEGFVKIMGKLSGVTKADDGGTMIKFVINISISTK